MEISGVITTGQLEEICKRINKENGEDSRVCIQISDNGTLLHEESVVGFCKDVDGTLYLLNEPFKHGNCF